VIAPEANDVTRIVHEERRPVKSLVAIATAATLVAGITSLTAAQTGTTTAPAPAPAPEKKVDKGGEMKKADKKMASKSASGTVKSASPDSVVVGGKEKGKDSEWTFGVDSKTSVKKGGKAATAADLKTGDAVTVRYMEHDGKAVAQAISVRGDAAKKDVKPAEKK
jgi:Domain of unknown function (DUF5666)